MKKFISGVFLVFVLLFTTVPTYAANVQITIDGIVIPSDVNPEITKDRTMVPLRVISENLGAKVNWSNNEITVTKNDMQIIFNLNTNSVMKNGKSVPLDVKPYIKNGRTLVPIRFLAEAFNCNVNYINSTVIIETEPLIINNVKINTLQQEFNMTMGSVVQQINGNEYKKSIYEIFIKNKVKVPADVSFHFNYDNPGSYYKVGQYDFLNQEDESILRYDIYSLVQYFPDDTLKGYPKYLLYDANEEQWYVYTKSTLEAINQLIDNAYEKGFIKIISNTVS